MPSPSLEFNHQFPSYDLLRKKAKQKTPKFAFDYLTNGCFDGI